MPQTLRDVLASTDWAALALQHACLAGQIQSDRATHRHLLAEGAHTAADLALEQALTLSDLLTWIEAMSAAARAAGYLTLTP